MEGTLDGGNGGSVVLVATPPSSQGPSDAATAVVGAAALAASERAADTQGMLAELSARMARAVEVLGLEVSALRERLDVVSAVLASAMEDIDLEDQEPGEEELEQEEEISAGPAEEPVIELSDTPGEEAAEEDQRDSDVAGRTEGTGDQPGKSESTGGTDATESEQRKRASITAKTRRGPFAR